MNIDERIIDLIGSNDANWDYETKELIAGRCSPEAIKELLRDVVEQGVPERVVNIGNPEGSGFNAAIDEMESNTKEVFGE